METKISVTNHGKAQHQKAINTPKRLDTKSFFFTLSLKLINKKYIKKI